MGELGEIGCLHHNLSCPLSAQSAARFVSMPSAPAHPIPSPIAYCKPEQHLHPPHIHCTHLRLLPLPPPSTPTVGGCGDV
jgi:hypothetical protein